MNGLFALLIVFIVISTIFSKLKQSIKAAEKKASPAPQPISIDDEIEEIVKEETPAPPIIVESKIVNGGSIPTTAIEGEAPQEHAQHVKQILASEAHERKQVIMQNSLRQASISRLRDAVIMSEILAKPKALRYKYR